MADYLQKNLSEDSSCHWYTCFGELPEQAWKGICGLLGHVDSKAAEYLANLDLPQLELLGYIAQIMEQFCCERETILVIDNYQLAGFPAPYRLLDTLSFHQCGKLHIVVLTQPITAEGIWLDVSSPHILKITQSDFCFDTSDIRRLFHHAGVSLTVNQAEALYDSMGGWIAALQLQLSSFHNNRKFHEQEGIDELMARSYWRFLNEEQKTFGMRLSLLDTFTEEQASVLMDDSVVPARLWSMVCSNFL